MTMCGASNETKDEMLKGLKYPLNYSDSSIASSFEVFTSSVRRQVGLKIGNLIEKLSFSEIIILHFRFIIF